MFTIYTRLRADYHHPFELQASEGLRPKARGCGAGADRQDARRSSIGQGAGQSAGQAMRRGSRRASIAAGALMRQLQEVQTADEGSAEGDAAAQCDRLRKALETTRQELFDVYQQARTSAQPP